MKQITQDNAQVRHADVAKLAKQFWEREGRKPGRDLEYWLRAERQLLGGQQKSNQITADPLEAGKKPQQGTTKTIRLPDSVKALTHS